MIWGLIFVGIVILYFMFRKKAKYGIVKKEEWKDFDEGVWG